MGDFKLNISEEAVNVLMKVASDLIENSNTINNAVKELKESFNENKGGMDPVLASLQQLIDDLDDTTQGTAIKPLLVFESKLLKAAAWRRDKLDGEELNVKVKKLTKHR